MQRYENCRLFGNEIVYLGRTGVFEDKLDQAANESNAWDFLEKEGWELVSVVIDRSGQPTAYFKRPYKK